MSNTIQNTDFRIEKRFPLACPIYIHGITESGEQIKTNSITENISQQGLLLRSHRLLKLGSKVFALIQLMSGAKLAARGEVIRIEKNKHQLSGLAIHFNQHKLIPSF